MSVEAIGLRMGLEKAVPEISEMPTPGEVVPPFPSSGPAAGGRAGTRIVRR